MDRRLKLLVILLGLVSASLMAQSASVGVTLRQAADEALANNPGIRALRSRVSAAEMGTKEARAAYLPRLDFEELFTNGDDPVYVFGSLLRQGEFAPRHFDPAFLNNPSPINNFNHRLILSQELYDGGRRQHQSSLTDLGLESSHQVALGAEQQLLFALVRDYYRILLADESVKLAQESIHSAESDLAKARERMAVGTAVKSDVLRLEVQVSDFHRALLAAENEARLARQELEVELGREPTGRFEPADSLVERVFPANPEMLQTVAAFRRRPDTQQAFLAAASAREKVFLAREAYRPSVGLVASYDFNNGTSTGLGNHYLLGIRLQFNLLDGGSKSASLKQALAEQEASDHLQREVHQRAQLQIQATQDRRRLALEQYSVAKESGRWAEESLRIVKNRHEAGLATVTDLLSAQVASHQSRLSASRALYSYYVESAAVELAAGTLTEQSSFFTKP